MGDKFRRSNSSVFSIGGNVLTCVLDVDYDEAVDVYWSDCDDATSEKTPVAGGIQTSGTLTQEIADDDTTQLGYTSPTTSGALVDQPNGAVQNDINIAGTISITGRQIRTSRTGLSTVSCNFVCAGITITAVP